MIKTRGKNRLPQRLGLTAPVDTHLLLKKIITAMNQAHLKNGAMWEAADLLGPELTEEKAMETVTIPFVPTIGKYSEVT